MREFTYFYYAGKYSKDFGIVAVNVDNGMLEETFLSGVKIEEASVRNRSKPYFQGVTRSPFSFTLQIAFENQYDEDLIREVARWLRQDTYQEFYFVDDPIQKRYFCMPTEDITLIHNGLNQGYLKLTMRCDDANGYTPEYLTREYDFSKNPILYEEDDDADFQQGTLNNLVVDNGKLKLAKEGVDLSNVKDDKGDWDRGTYDRTTAVNGVLELDYEVQPGTDLEKIYDINTDWNTGSVSGVQVINGSIKLAKEGIDKIITPTWTGTKNNVSITGNTVQLDWQYAPGTDINITDNTKIDWERTGSENTGVETQIDYDHLILPKEGADVVYSEESGSELNTGVFNGTAADTTNGYIYALKEGQDYTEANTLFNTQNTSTSIDTHNGTTNSNSLLLLLKEGTDFIKMVDLTTDFNASGYSVNGISTSGDKLTLSNQPAYTFKDTMTNWKTNWVSVTNDGYMTQYSYFTRIAAGKSGSEQGIYTTVPAIPTNFTCTIDFQAAVSGKVNILISDGNNYHKIMIPTTDDDTPSWFRVQLNGIYKNNVIVYRNGVQVPVAVTSVQSNNTYPKQIRFSIDYATAGTIDLYKVYFINSQLGTPPVGGIYSGQYISPAYDITTVSKVASSLIEYSYSWNSNINSYQSVKVEVQKLDGSNNILQDWTLVTSGSPLTALSKGTSVTSGVKYKVRVTIETDDGGYSPTVDWFRLTVVSAYKTSGSFVMQRDLNSRNIVKIGYGTINLVGLTTPSGTNLTVQVEVSYDNKSTWTNMGIIPNGGTWKPSNQSLSLSTAWLRITVTLTTSDVAVTPTLDEIDFSVYSGYKKAVTRETNPISIIDAKKAGSAILSWTNAGDAVTSITAQSSLSTDGGTTWSSYQSVTNGGQIPQITQATDLSNALVKFKFTLDTTDTSKTAMLDYVNMKITSGYKTSGSWISPAISLGNVHKIKTSSISWIGDQPTNTNITVSVRDGKLFYQEPTFADTNTADGVADGWTAYGKSTSGITSTWAIDTDGSQKIDVTSSSGVTGSIVKMGIIKTLSINTGKGYRLSVDAKTANMTTNTNATLVMTFKDNASNSSEFVMSPMMIQNNGDYKRYFFFVSVPTDRTYVTCDFKLQLQIDNTSTSNNIGTVWFKNVQIEEWNSSGNFTTQTNGSPIALYANGSPVASDLIFQYKVSLTTSDTLSTPQLDQLTLSIDATEGERWTSGYYEEVDISLAQVGKAGSAMAHYSKNIPTGTTAKFEIAFDLGSGYGAYQEVSTDTQFPQITQTTNLSNAKFKFKISLTTQAGTTVTPDLTLTSNEFISGYFPSGTWTSPQIDMSQVSKVVSSLIEIQDTLPANTSINVQVRKGTGSPITWGSWTSLITGTSVEASPVTGFEPNTLTSGTYLQIQCVLSNTNTLYTPEISWMRLFVDATVGERYQRGTYESEPIPLASVVKAGTAKLDWTFNAPSEIDNESHIRALVSLSPDNGVTWTEYVLAEDDFQFLLEQQTDLTNVKLKYKYIIDLDDVTNLTPNVSRSELKITSGYKPSGYRISPVIDLTDAEYAYSSLIAWTATTPEDTSVAIEVSFDNGETWYKATNGLNIPTIYDGAYVHGKQMIIRETIQTNDTSKSGEIEYLKLSITMGMVFNNTGDLEVRPEIWIKKIGDGDVEIINRDTGDSFKFTGLTDGEEVYVDNDLEDIVSSLDGVYRYDNFNDGYMVIPRGRNDLEVRGTCKIQMRYRLRLL